MKWSNVTHLTHVKLPYAISWAYLSTVENLILDLNPTRYPIFCNISSSKLSNLKRSWCGVNKLPVSVSGFLKERVGVCRVHLIEKLLIVARGYKDIPPFPDGLHKS